MIKLILTILNSFPNYIADTKDNSFYEKIMKKFVDKNNINDFKNLQEIDITGLL